MMRTTLVRNADAAMYQAKQTRNAYRFYSQQRLANPDY